MKNQGLTNKDRRGFTLIELLVVVAIIGLLSGIVLVGMQGVRAQARDSKRLSDMRQLVNGITMYYDKYGVFPPITTDACCDGWDTGPCVADFSNQFIGALKTAGIMTAPFDPGPVPSGTTSASCNYGYSYYVYPAGNSGCDTNRGRFYVLGVRNLETTTGTHPKSPGFRCPSRNWQGEFEWVIGGFEKDF